MKSIKRAFIEELKDTIISSNADFKTNSIRDLLYYRKNNMTITQMCWITLRPVISSDYTIYNPKTLIIITLN